MRWGSEGQKKWEMLEDWGLDLSEKQKDETEKGEMTAVAEK